MAKEKDQLSKRLAAIKTAKPVNWTPPPPVKEQAEHRDNQRTPSYRFARVVLPDRSEVKCIIKDVSPGGVKLVLEGANALPPRITLKIDQTGQTLKATVVWQKEEQVGLAFDKGPV